MGKSKRNRNKDRRSTVAYYYDEREPQQRKKDRKKTRHDEHDRLKRDFDDWESL